MWISKHGIIIQGLTTFSWRRSLPYSNQSIGFQSKSMDWFLYDRYLRHERVKNVDATISVNFLIIPFILPLLDTRIITIFTFCLFLCLYFTVSFFNLLPCYILFLYLLNIYYIFIIYAWPMQNWGAKSCLFLTPLMPSYKYAAKSPALCKPPAWHATQNFLNVKFHGKQSRLLLRLSVDLSCYLKLFRTFFFFFFFWLSFYIPVTFSQNFPIEL